MEVNSSFSFLKAIDVAKYSINQAKKQSQSSTFELRASLHQSSVIELSFTHSFQSETLITNLEVDTFNLEEFEKNFENAQIKVSSLGNRGHYCQLINLKVEKRGNLVMYSGAGFTNCIKIIFILKGERKKAKQTQKEQHQVLAKIISENIKDIRIFGCSMNSNPSPVLLTSLLNISESFKKFSLLQQAAQTDSLVSLCLVSSRRFVQAAETLRKVSKFYLEKYHSNKSIMDYSKSEKSWIKEIDDDIGLSSIKSSFGGKTLEGNKFLQKSAKVQLLLADTISHPSLILEKLEAYYRCNSYSCGVTNSPHLNFDVDFEEKAILIFPQIIGFLLKTLSDRLEPIRVASLKSIQFFIETLGCSIGLNFLQILREVINTYPNNYPSVPHSHKVPQGLYLQIEDTQHKQSEEGASGMVKNKIIVDHYHHLLETLISLISQVNKKFSISIFGEVILPSLLSKSPSLELKLYLLRFTEKLIGLLGADLNIEVSLIGLLLSFCEQKSLHRYFFANELVPRNNRTMSNIKQDQAVLTHNKQIVQNLVYISHKILSAIKLKVLPRYSGHKLHSFLEWINKTLIYLGENQTLPNSNSSHSLFIFNTILDFISLIYSSSTSDSIRLQLSPIETILHFANTSIHHSDSGIQFDKVSAALVTLVNYHCKSDANFGLGKQIVSRILEKSKQNNLNLKQLQILVKILPTVDDEVDLVLQWLDVYLGCIPHSTFDETYHVFCILIRKVNSNFDSYPNKQNLLHKMVRTLFDQYTVKGKAHQQAKQTLISSFIKNQSFKILDLLEICLFKNSVPMIIDYESKKKGNAPSKMNKTVENHFDSKGYRIQFELFLQKISFSQLIFTKIVGQTPSNTVLLNDSFIQKFFRYIRHLSNLPNIKLKGKSFSLMNYFIQIFWAGWKQSKIELETFEVIVKNIFEIHKESAIKIKDSKLMYNVVYNLLALFKINDVDIHLQSTELNKIDFCTEPRPNVAIKQISEPMKSKIGYSILLAEFTKIWHWLNSCLQSPWENVRQIYILLLLEVFKVGISQIPLSLVKKVKQINTVLLSNLFGSIEHTQRQAALKLFGCLLGLRSCSLQNQNLIASKIKQNLIQLKPFIENLYESSFDWNEANTEISQNLCSICLSEQSKELFALKQRQKILKRSVNEMDRSYLSFNFGDEGTDKRFGSLIPNIDNSLMKEKSSMIEDEIGQQDFELEIKIEDLIIKTIQFRGLIEKEMQAKNEIFGQKQSFLEQNEEQFYDIGEERAESLQGKDKSSEEHLEFEDLGIIELDDQQWGEQEERSEKALQKLPIRKMNKLSPSVLNSSKPQRIRSKRFHQNQFDYRERIIVDELQEKINNGKKSSDVIEQVYAKQNYFNLPKFQADDIESHVEGNQKLSQKVQKKQLFKHNETEPFLIEDDDEESEEMVYKNLTENRQSPVLKFGQKKREKSQLDKEFRERSSQKKTKKGPSNTRKRKYSVGK